MTMLTVGDVLEGRYKIEAPIARGGMSTVYRCIDLRLGRNVAAKVMDDRYVDDPIFRQRFKREARSMAQLSHPQLVGVYDFSSTGEHIFLIMELITGGTLRELLAERGPMPPHAAAAVLSSVLTGLDVAHRAGMVHRDIKPDNVLINGDHQVKLADFGLVRAASASPATSNQIVGTVSYLSPEQVSGADITPASDVYSAGILLFELLTGTTPFSGHSQLAHAYARLDSTVPAPSSRIDGVPKLFDELVATATALDPAERFADAGEFLSALTDVSRELQLPPFQVPVPMNSAAHRASEGLSPATSQTDLLTTDIPRSPEEGVSPTTRTKLFQETPPASETRQFTPPTSLFPEAAAPVPQPPVTQPPEARVQEPVEPERGAPKVSNRGKAGFAVWLVTVLVFTAAVAIGAWWFGSGRYGEIPQVLGMNQIQAVAAVEEAGFSTQTASVYSDDVKENLTVGTDPAYGDRAVKGDPVTVLVSLGKPTVPEVPSDRSLDTYQQLLDERTLTLNTGEQQYSDTVPTGGIVSVSPSAGQTVSTGSAVTVHTSKGAAPVTVPDVEGLSQAQATSQLEKLGLKVTTSEQFSDKAAKGDAFGTDPVAGTSLPKGSSVTLNISTAVEIPDLTGKTQKEATAALAAAGLKVGDVSTSTSATGSKADQVASTSPDAGSLVDPAQTSVNLVLVGKVEVPNVIGKTVKDAKATLTAAGFTVKVSGSASANARVYWQSPMSIGATNANEGTEVTIRARS